MDKRSVFGGLAAAAIAASAVNISIAEAVYYPPPENLGVSAGSIEIEKDSMNGDIVAEVPLYVHNNPGFSAIKVIAELDSRLSFDTNVVSTDIDGIAGVLVSSCGGQGNTFSLCFTADGERFQGDREIGRLRVNVPAGAETGRYDISFLRECGDEKIFIDTYNKRSARFYEEYFSDLEGGSITVTDNNAVQESTGAAQEQEPVRGEAAEETVTSEAATVRVQTESAVIMTAVTTQKDTALKTVVPEVYDSPEEQAATAAAAEEIPEQTADKEKKHNSMLVPVIIAVLLELGTAIVLILRRGGRSK